jgi:methyl-accepting chemotaxis protein
MHNTTKIAQDLTLTFSDESDIPSRFKKGKTKKETPNSLIEQRFQKNVTVWKQTIDTMSQKIDSEKALRFIMLKPNITSDLQSVTHSQDFIDFSNYFAQRRDIDKCDDDELGSLAMLFTAFQRKIEQSIKK